MTDRKLTEICIYWDEQDPADPGWAWRATYSDDHEESGPVQIDANTEIEAAIDWACYCELDVSLTPDDFGIDRRVEGGVARWIAD